MDIEALVKQMLADREGFTDKQDKAAKAQEALKKQNDAKQRELDELQTSTQNQIQGLRQQIADLRDEVTKVTAAKDKSEKDAMKAEAELKSELSTREQEVVKLKRRKFEVEYPIPAELTRGRSESPSSSRPTRTTPPAACSAARC